MDLFRQLAKFLRDRFPVKRKLVIRRVKLNDHGSTSINGAETCITISVNIADELHVQIETLAHEFAHALEYDKWGNHTDRWGKLYADVYKAWTEWDAKPMEEV